MTRQPAKISIVTACYQSVRTLERTIKSVLGQGYPNLEYILVDGGSTDGTLDIIRKYEKQISRWVSEKDKGVYDAMNKGIAMATGDWVGLLNSDDVYLPCVLERVNAQALEGDPEILYANIRMMYRDRMPMPYNSAAPLSPGHFWRMPIWHPTVFVKKAVYDADGAFLNAYRISGDFELMLRLHSRGRRFRHVDEVWVEMDADGLSDKRWMEGKREVRKAAESHGAFTLKVNLLYRLDIVKCRLSGSLEKMPLLSRLQRIYRNSKAGFLRRS